jgi:hypothetical protein
MARDMASSSTSKGRRGADANGASTDASEEPKVTVVVEADDGGAMPSSAGAGANGTAGAVAGGSSGGVKTMSMTGAPTATRLLRLYGARFPAEINTRGCHWIPRMFA